jgi:ribonuclease HI
MVSRYKPKTHILLYTDGSCLNQNSRTDVRSRRAGCAVVYGTMALSGQTTTHPSGLCFRLENRGWDGNIYAATSNRAELRAATAAPECRLWGTEGWRQATIATDSTYVVDGITDWVVKWQARDWTKSTGEDVANKDLWKRLLHLVNEQTHHGCEVIFWHINRAYNDQADRWAKSAADRPEIEEYKEFDLVETEATYRPRIVD